MNKISENKAITLIALVITIIVLLILAAVTLNIVLGENGIFSKARNAKEETEYSSAKEILDLKLIDIQTECAIEGKEYTLDEIANELDTDTQILIEKYYAKSSARVSTNAGTKPQSTEIKGIVLSIEKYSKFKFLIGEAGNIIGVTKGSIPSTWTSGVLPEGFTPLDEFEREIGSNSTGSVEEQIKIGDNLVVQVQEINTSNLARKTNISFNDLFDTIWARDGKGTQVYNVEGNLEFNNTEFTSNSLTNISQLELGTYRITYTATTPGGTEQTAYKDVTISSLAQENNKYAIYSSYDLAKFRDMVNNGQTTINAIQKADLDMTKVCSATIGTWTPIGENNFFMGTYDGDNKNINNIYINRENTNCTATAFISKLGYTGIAKNIHLNGGSIISNAQETSTGGIVGRNEGNIQGCINEADVNGLYVASGGICGNNLNTITGCTNKGRINYNVTTQPKVAGGISGFINTEVLNSNNEITIQKAKIENCINEGAIYKKEYSSSVTDEGVGGIVGSANGRSEIINCHNRNTVTSEGRCVGGIVGNAYNQMESISITRCSNTSNITSENGGSAGGIVGDLYNGTVNKCYNANCSVTVNRLMYAAGGIVGRSFESIIQNCYTYLDSNNSIYAYGNAGGIVGIFRNDYGPSVIENSYVIGNGISSEEGVSSGALLGCLASMNNSEIKNSYYLSTVNDVGYSVSGATFKTKTTTALNESTLNKSALATSLNNGSSIWTTESNKNNGYPILIDNKPN